MVLFNFLTFDDMSDIGFLLKRFRLLFVESQDYFGSEKLLMSWEIC